MNKPNQQKGLQLNLLLQEESLIAIPESKQKELALALVELLVSGYRDSMPSTVAGGENEPEADR